MKAAQSKQNYEQLQKLTRTVSPSVARRKHPQSYPRKSNKAHTADLSRFVGEKSTSTESGWILKLVPFCVKGIDS